MHRSQKHTRRRARQRLSLETLERRYLLTSAVITEFMAINNSTLQDEDGEFSDWIELHNPTPSAVNLDGWFLTDDADDLPKWRFPGVTLEAGEYLVVFASNKDRIDPASPLHTNFRLTGDGEYLALLEPDAQTIATRFDPYPQQVADVAYGLGVEAATSTLLPADAPLAALVPSDDSLDLTWTETNFDDGGWLAGAGGAGFDLQGDYAALIGADLEAAMHTVNSGAYLRASFDVADASAVDTLSLNVQYDDGFIAYLNGQEVASRNAQPLANSPPSGLVSFWQFEGNTDDNASDFANNAGTVEDNLSARGGTARFVAGKVGQALAVGVQGGDATDLSAPLSDDVKLPAAYAIEAWINPTELSDSWQRLVLNWGGGEFSYHFAIRNNSGFANGVSLFHGQSNGAQPNTNGGTVQLNQWQHIAGVADGTRLRVYLNGVEVDSVPYDGTIHTATSEGLGLGDSFSSLSGIKFNGLVDELAMWEVPLSAQQVRSHYEAGALGYGLTRPEDPTIVAWDATALLERPDSESLAVERIDVSNFTEFVEPGRNVLAIHGLNHAAGDDDFLVRAELQASDVSLSTEVRRFFTSPTPGDVNSVGASDLGPIVEDVTHEFLAPEGITITPLVTSNDPIQVLVPTDDSLGLDWTRPDYVPGSNGESWTTGLRGVGFDLEDDFDSWIDIDVETEMRGQNGSAFLRAEFDVADPSEFDRLKLNVQYDDGFVAFLNGEPLARQNSANGVSPPSGLVTYYDFDGTTNDNSSQYENGSGSADDHLVGLATNGQVSPNYEAGLVGQAVRISRAPGEAAVLEAADSNDLDLSASWTVEAFVKPDSANTGEWDRFATKWFNGSNQWHWAFRYADNGQDLFVNGSQVIDGNTTFPVPLNQWTHVAWTGDPDQGINLWQNGRVIATAPYQAISSGSDPFRLGNRAPADAALQFSGLVDEFAIWSVALSGEQLLAHAAAEPTGYGLTPLGGNAEQLQWNSVASQPHADGEAVMFQEFDVSEHRHLLRAGSNVLAIQGLNVAADDDDFLLAAQLSAERGSDTGKRLKVTAAISPTTEPIDTARLVYRVMYDSEQSLPMVDDGTGEDDLAGDGIFTGVIPGGAAETGEMVRYYVLSSDAQANGTRAPLFHDPLNSPEYYGEVFEDPALTTQLPVFHRFLENPGAAETGSGTRASVYYLGEFYDNVFIRIRGGTARNWPKKSYKIEFNDGNHFRFRPDERRVDEFNLNATYTDKSYVRPVLAYELHRDAGSAAPITFYMRVHQNGRFFSVAEFVEQPDKDFLRREGLDDDGSLYKGTASPTNGLTGNASGGFEKKTRKNEDFSDLQALIDGLAQSGQALEDYVFDNIDLPAQINFMAVNVILQNIDATDKNFYIYRDTEGNGEWRMLPWDLDLVLGPNALNTDTIVAQDDASPAHTSHPYLGSLTYPYHGRKNHLFDAIIENPRTNEMFLRRVRTLMDQMLKPAGAPAEELYFENRIDELIQLLQPDVQEDKAAWGGNAHFGAQDYTLQAANDRIKNEYLAPRRVHLFETHVQTNGGEQPTTVLAANAAKKAFVPVDDSLGLSWTQLVFDDNQWLDGTDGVGYDEATTYRSLIGLDLRSPLFPAEQRIDTDGDGTSENDSAYLRALFPVSDPNALTELRLRIKYDDGFIAYLNGTPVAQANAPAAATWNSPSTQLHDDGAALVYENFDISAFGGPGGVLVPGANVLAIHLLNDDTNGPGTSSDMLAAVELVNGVITAGAGVGIPAEQAGFPHIDFGDIDQDPVSGNQDEKYIQLVNPNDQAVDISGWSLRGGVDHTFAPGTVLTAGGSLYVSPNVVAFRGRTTGPSGGQARFVQGNYDGHLSNLAELVELVAQDGTVIDSFTTEFNPSDAQQYLRVTEIMYHPSPPTPEETAAGFADADDFEFLELRNTSDSTALDLSNIRVTRGFELDFSFSGSNVTSLAPGEFVLLVSNQAAFEFRYGSQLNSAIAGQYIGRLDNGGEAIKVEDANDNTIQDFSYNDNVDKGWPAAADGQGSSLETADTAGDYDDPTNWFASGRPGGSPAAVADTAVAGRYVFYDNSYHDDESAGRDDNDAIAADKRALLWGQKASFDNYTTYSRGINGIMIDIVASPAGAALTTADFVFRRGGSDDVASWGEAPAPASVQLLQGAGIGGSDRAVLVWDDDAIRNQWLQVTVLATANTGLTVNDEFFFGNAAGETGNSNENTFVDAADFAGVRDNPRSMQNRAPLDDPFDFNRDSFVDASDLAVVRDNHTNFLTSLRLITPVWTPPGPGLWNPGLPPSARDERAAEQPSTPPPGQAAQRRFARLDEADPAADAAREQPRAASDLRERARDLVLQDLIDWLD